MLKIITIIYTLFAVLFSWAAYDIANTTPNWTCQTYWQVWDNTQKVLLLFLLFTAWLCAFICVVALRNKKAAATQTTEQPELSTMSIVDIGDSLVWMDRHTVIEFLPKHKTTKQ